jgi:hypothetical protein
MKRPGNILGHTSAKLLMIVLPSEYPILLGAVGAVNSTFGVDAYAGVGCVGIVGGVG